MSKSFSDMASNFITQPKVEEVEAINPAAVVAAKPKTKKANSLLSEYKAENKTRQVTVLIKPSLFEAGKAYAQANGLKSFNNFVNYAIERALTEK